MLLRLLPSSGMCVRQSSHLEGAMPMSNEDIIKLVMWTMQYYGSDAGERAEPGSKLKSQAEHIAEVIAEYHEAHARLHGLNHVTITLFGHNL